MLADRESDAGDQLRLELRDASVPFRVLFIVYALVGAFGGLYGGYLLLHETGHWVGWAIALVIVEPIGVACALAIGAIIAPDSVFASLLFGAIRRARVAISLIGVALFLFIGGTLAYVAWYFAVTARQ